MSEYLTLEVPIGDEEPVRKRLLAEWAKYYGHSKINEAKELHIEELAAELGYDVSWI